MSYGNPSPWVIHLFYGKNARESCTPGALAISAWDRSLDWREAMDFIAGVSRPDIGRIHVVGIGDVFQELR